MACAAIIFVDIVGYSKRSQADQKAMVDAMTRIAREEVADLTSAWAPGVVMLPTGDGLAVVFLDTAGDWLHRVRRALRLAACLLHGMPEVGGFLRVGVHAGEVGKVDDVNNRRNVFGAAINMAQRVMDAANDGQCLISEAAWDPCVGGVTAGEWFDLLPDDMAKARVHLTPHTVMVKHGRHASVRVVDLEWQKSLLTGEEAPRSKDQTVLEFTPLPKNGERFRETLAGARQIAFVQVTGGTMLPLLQPEELRAELTHLWVFMPSAQALASVAARVPLQAPESQDATIAAWEELLKTVHHRHPKADVHLGIMDATPGFGASMLDWDGPDGRLHISPLVWGTPLAETPGYDIRWNQNRRPTVAAPYINMLRQLRHETGPDKGEK